MNFAQETDTLIKPFLKMFGQCEKPPLSKEDTTLYQSVLLSLYQDIYAANATIFKDGCFQHQVVSIATESDKTKQPKDRDSRYFPAHIQTYITENEKYQLHFSCGNVGEREINVIFTLFAEEELNRLNYYTQYVRMMYIWLHICGSYADKNCTETLNVFIYPTPFTKLLPNRPGSIIGPENINTAFTFSCAKNGQIIIFREEEWFKVFIHETFHSYGLDFATNDHSSLKNVLREIFPINSDFDIYEAYTETWARIINCAFCSFNALANKKDKKGFLSNLNFCFEMERMFAMYQCIKILGFMGLNYKDLYLAANEKHTPASVILRKLYKENTHVFAYFIMTAIFLNDQPGFMLWCKKNNTRLLKFNPVPDNFKSFETYIRSIYDCISLLNSMLQMKTLNHRTKNKELMTTTRMSIIHTI